MQYEMDDGAMSPRRTTEDIEALGKQARDELRMYAKFYPPRLKILYPASRRDGPELTEYSSFLGTPRHFKIRSS